MPCSCPQGDFEFPGARNELASPRAERIVSWAPHATGHPPPLAHTPHRSALAQTPWNLWLRGAIPSLFAKAVTRLQHEEDFTANFYQFVPLKSEVARPPRRLPMGLL